MRIQDYRGASGRGAEVHRSGIIAARAGRTPGEAGVKASGEAFAKLRKFLLQQEKSFEMTMDRAVRTNDAGQHAAAGLGPPRPADRLTRQPAGGAGCRHHHQ